MYRNLSVSAARNVAMETKVIPCHRYVCYRDNHVHFFVNWYTHPFDPTGTNTDEEIESAIKSIRREGFLDKLVFDERTEHLSHGAKGLIRSLLNPDCNRRMSSAEFLFHPWVQGSTASQKVMTESNKKLRKFWRRRFKNAMLKEFAAATGRGSEPSSLSEKDIESLFHTLDLDGNGTLEVDEAKVALRGILGDDNSLDEIFRSVDEDGNGVIEFSEFKSVLRQKFDDGPGVSIHRTKHFQSAVLQRFDPQDGLSDEALRNIFDAIDLDGSGELTIDELEMVFGKLARKDEEHVSDWVDSIDADLSGRISFDEFKDAMKKIFK
uniref:EF-hand domain-containing protein n=1 Tax=Asterionellopsis glacialis TaxID=33640 RepID=A0A7S0KZ38_9STRA|mmetsp:Transcript_1935/g.2838  ORF Transcript_1935/g.2838 Transcript_1935/m.2838 type:complete len:322 (+) Transcript_1935:360-1325(+)